MATEITRPLIKTLRVQMNEALALLKADYPDLDIRVGNASYDSNGVTFKVKCAKNGSDGGTSKDEAVYNSHAKYHNGLPGFGETFSQRGEVFTISGWMPKGRKFKILAKNAAGSTFKFTVAGVRMAHELAVAKAA